MKKADDVRFTRRSSGAEAVKWRSQTQLIWDPDEVETHFEQPKNSFCHFRKVFELPSKPSQASLKIFADSRYKLYVTVPDGCSGTVGGIEIGSGRHVIVIKEGLEDNQK
jgi:hypothetical protein